MTGTNDMNEQTPYELIGAESGVRELVDRFYDHMDSETEAADVRSLHAKSLRASREKLFLFLSGWLGGPDLYVQKYGHPMLRRRHLPFAIGKRERDQWMHCMRKALDDMPIEDPLKQKLEQAFMATADHMRNQPEHEDDGRLRVFPGK
jgi:hemoglobin